MKARKWIIGIAVATLLVLAFGAILPYAFRSEINISYCQEPPPESVSCGTPITLCINHELIPARFTTLTLNSITWSDQGCGGTFPNGNQGAQVQWIPPVHTDPSGRPKTCTIRATVQATQTSTIALFGESTRTIEASLDHIIEVEAVMEHLSFAVANHTLNIPDQTSITVDLSQPASAGATLRLRPDNANISINAQAPGAREDISVPVGATSASFSITAHSAGYTGITAELDCYHSAQVMISVATPSIKLDVDQPDITLQWGNTGSVLVSVEGQRGFSGMVNLTIDNVPFGVSPTFTQAQLNVPQNGTATTTLSLATVAGGTFLPPRNPRPMRVRATPLTTGIARASDNLTLRIHRTNGSFNSVTLQRTDHTCGTIIAEVNSNNDAVRFTNPTLSLSTTRYYDFDPGYAIPPQCRIGLVVLAATDNLLIFNLGFDPGIGPVNTPGSPINPSGTGPTTLTGTPSLWVSPDNSLLLFQTASGRGTTPYLIRLYDIGRDTELDPYDSEETVQSIEIVGNIVTLTTNLPPGSPGRIYTWMIK